MVFVDVLTLQSLLHVIWKEKAWTYFLQGNKLLIFYFSKSASGKWINLINKSNFIEVREFFYNLVDAREDDGSWVFMKTATEDLTDITHRIFNEQITMNPFFIRFARKMDEKYLRVLYIKKLADEIQPVFMKIKIVAWYRREKNNELSSVNFYLLRRFWTPIFQDFVSHLHVNIVGQRRFSTNRHYAIGQYLRRSVVVFGLMMRKMVSFFVVKAKVESESLKDLSDKNQLPVIALPYSGKGLTLDLSKNTDLFWIPFTGIKPTQHLIYFFRTDDIYDLDKYAFFKEHALQGVALLPDAATASKAIVWNDKKNVGQLLRQVVGVLFILVKSLKSPMNELYWLFEHALEYTRNYHYWFTFFCDFHIKIHVNFMDWTTERVAADQALNDLGGISISYQRTRESFARPLWASAVHVQFVFSHLHAEIEQRAGSQVRQLVAAGYVHDHAFLASKERARLLRRKLEDVGVKFIISFYDENSVEDPRDHVSHAYSAENYKFLLERVLEDDQLGLVLKPKKPSTLSIRLGPVYGLLQKALETGRCFLFDDGIVATSALPCEAGLASDVSIGLLFGATAALESRLAGVSTLLLDREGMPYHPLYKLGVGRVIFEDWESLWQCLCKYRSNPESVVGFGDWSLLNEELDPFQDGHAAERMGTYIGWLAQELTNGADRDTALNIVRDKYVSMWGQDKIATLS